MFIDFINQYPPIILFLFSGTRVAATASLVRRLNANSTILIDASPLKDLGASDNPKILLIAELAMVFSPALFSGNTVAFEV
jgi:hypothetical protein